MLHTAGLKIDGNPRKLFATIQRVGHTLAGKVKGVGSRSFSRKEDIPRWWKSKSRGADGTDGY